MAERRRKIISMIQDNPSLTQNEIAEIFGVNRATISRDIKTITEELKVQNVEAWMMHRDRVLGEIRAKKELCNSRLMTLKNSPHQGSRWLEEWNKLVDKEIRILGLNSPERLMIGKDETFDKTRQDKAIDAMMLSIDNDIIDIESEDVKQLSPPTIQ